jgi:hypothetical protein
LFRVNGRDRRPLGAELGRGTPAPARVIEHGAEHGARQRHEIGLAARDDVFGLLRFGDEADWDGCDAGAFLHAFRERKLIARPDRDLLQIGDNRVSKVYVANTLAGPPLSGFSVAV